MSLFGDITGIIQGNSAKNQLDQQYLNAENGVVNAVKGGQQGVNTALTNAGTNVNAAGATAIGGVNAATGTANTDLSTLQSQLTGNLNPYIGAGQQGVTSLANYAASNPTFSFDPNSTTQNPGYQFLAKQGANAVQNSAAAQGMAQGGLTAAALEQYGQGLAATYENQLFNQAQSQFQTNQNTTLANLSALTNTGLQANSQNNTVAQNLTGQQAANTIGAGVYAGNTNTSLQQYLAGLNTQGQEFNSNTGIQGSKLAGDYAVGYGGVQAAGTMNVGNQLTNGAVDLAGLLFGGGG